jgi:hypothetical protein
LDNISKKLSPKKRVPLFLTLLLGQREFVSPLDSSKSPRLGALPSFTHVVAPAFEASLLSSLSLDLV